MDSSRRPSSDLDALRRQVAVAQQCVARQCRSWPDDEPSRRQRNRTEHPPQNFESRHSNRHGRDLLRRLEASGIERTFVDNFFAAYILPCSQFKTDDGYLDYLPALYRRAGPGSSLQATVSTIAYASMTEFKECQWMHDIVARCYARAVKLVQEALSDSSEAEKDTTLVSLLLLSMFENIYHAQPNHISWHSHIDQAVEILCKRGEKQFLSLVGLKLFHTIYAHMLISSLITKQRPVLPICVWENHFEPSARSQLMCLIHRTATICADFHEPSSPSAMSSSPSKPLIILREARELADDLQKWGNVAASEEMLETEGGGEFFSQYDLTEDQGSSHTKAAHLKGASNAAYRNIFCASCVLLHQVIYECCDHILSNQHLYSLEELSWFLSELGVHPTEDAIHESAVSVFQNLLIVSTQAIMHMAQEICRSVVQLLTASASSSNSSVAFSAPRAYSKNESESQQQGHSSLRKYALLFPLWAALSAYTMIIEAEQRQKLPVNLAELGGEAIRRQYELLEEATCYVRGDLGISHNSELGDWDLGVKLLAAPQEYDLVRVEDWLNRFSRKPATV